MGMVGGFWFCWGRTLRGIIVRIIAACKRQPSGVGVVGMQRLMQQVVASCKKTETNLTVSIDSAASQGPRGHTTTDNFNHLQTIVRCMGIYSTMLEKVQVVGLLMTSLLNRGCWTWKMTRRSHRGVSW